MNIEIRKDNWQSFLCGFCRKNYLRSASLELREGEEKRKHVNNLPFNKIGYQKKYKESPTINLFIWLRWKIKLETFP